MKTKKVYYRVQALPDEIIWFVSPTRKPRRTTASPDVQIDEDGIHAWNLEDPLSDDRNEYSDWGKGLWHTCVATALNTKRIIRKQVETRLADIEARLDRVAAQVERIEQKLDALLTVRGNS